MKNKLRLLCVVLLIIVCTGLIFAQEAKSQLIGDYNYEVTMMGQKIGCEHDIFEKTQYHGKDCYKDTVENLMKIKRSKDLVNEEKELKVSYSALDFSPLYEKSEKLNGTQKEVAEVSVVNNKIVFKTQLNDESPEEKKIDFEKGVIWGIDGLILKNKGLLKIGAKGSFKTISINTKSLDTESFEVLRKEKVKVMGEERNAYVIKDENSEMPGIVATVYVDDNGVMLKTDAAGMIIILTDASKAKKFEEVSTLSSYIDTVVNIPFSQRIKSTRLLVTLKDEYADVFPDNEYQKSVRSGNEYLVTLNSIPLDIKESPQIPIKSEEFKQYLEPSLTIQSADPDIIKQAQEIIKDEKDAAKIIKLIVNWINSNIKPEYDITICKSAKEALVDKSGVCTDFSSLCCAMARAAGVPARCIDGLVYQNGKFGYHAWDEVYLGKWIPVDAVFNRIGIPAIYVKLGEGEQGKKESVKSLASLAKMWGKTTIRINSFTDNTGKRFDLSGPDTYITIEGDTIEDKLSGIKITKPDGWELNGKPKAGGNIMLISEDGVVMSVAPIEVGPKEITKSFFADFVKYSLAAGGFTDVEMSKIKQTTIGKNQAFEVVTKGKVKNTYQKSRAILAYNPDAQKVFFIFTSAFKKAFDDSTEKIEEMLQNIQF